VRILSTNAFAGGAHPAAMHAAIATAIDAANARARARRWALNLPNTCALFPAQAVWRKRDCARRVLTGRRLEARACVTFDRAEIRNSAGSCYLGEPSEEANFEFGFCDWVIQLRMVDGVGGVAHKIRILLLQ
jgi:hypothetical protein